MPQVCPGYVKSGPFSDLVLDTEFEKNLEPENRPG